MPKIGSLILQIIVFVVLTVGVSAQKVLDEEAAGSEKIEPANSLPKESEPPDREKSSFKLKRGKWRIEIVPGFAPMQPVFFSGRKEYNTDGRRLAMFNVRFNRIIGTTKGVTYQYFFELTPLVAAFNNEVKNPQYISEKETPGESETVRRTAYGAGFQPVNFRFIFKPNKRFKPYAQVGVGMIFFDRKMPVPEATAYNFTGDFGGGFYFIANREKPYKAVTFSYRYFHISNFNTSSFNPGYNANIFSIGYSFSR